MSADSTSRPVVYRRTERLLRVYRYVGSLGAIVLVVALALGILRVLTSGVAVVLFAVGGILLMQLPLVWRWQRRLRQLHRVAESNPAALHERVKQMQKVDPQWLVMGAVAGLVLAAATIAFAVVVLHR